MLPLSSVSVATAFDNDDVMMPLDDFSCTPVSSTPPGAPAGGRPAPPLLADLLDEIEAVILHYVRLRAPRVVTVLALWVALTHL